MRLALRGVPSGGARPDLSPIPLPSSGEPDCERYISSEPGVSRISWPAWPNILRTSSSHEEGCARDWSITTHRFTGEDGRVTKSNFARVEWKKGDNGSLKMEEVPGSEFCRKVDLVLLAMGFVHVTHGKIIEELGVTGASLVVRAIFHGREAARNIDNYLKG